MKRGQAAGVSAVARIADERGPGRLTCRSGV
jgi:hypothetical protein